MYKTSNIAHHLTGLLGGASLGALTGAGVEGLLRPEDTDHTDAAARGAAFGGAFGLYGGHKEHKRQQNAPEERLLGKVDAENGGLMISDPMYHHKFENNDKQTPFEQSHPGGHKAIWNDRAEGKTQLHHMDDKRYPGLGVHFPNETGKYYEHPVYGKYDKKTNALLEARVDLRTPKYKQAFSQGMLGTIPAFSTALGMGVGGTLSGGDMGAAALGGLGGSALSIPLMLKYLRHGSNKQRKQIESKPTDQRSEQDNRNLAELDIHHPRQKQAWEQGFLKAAQAKGASLQKAKDLLHVVQVRIIAVGQPTDVTGEVMEDIFDKKNNRTVQVAAPKNNLPIGRATNSIIDKAKRA